MLRIIFILLLVPIFAVKAATPFVSVAVEPKFILPTQFWDYSDGVEVETVFLSLVNNFSIGISTNRVEWFARLSFSDSYTASDGSSSSQLTETYRNYFYTEEMEHLHQRHLSIGGHWLMTDGQNSRVRPYIGGGLTVGASDWYEHVRETVTTYDLEYNLLNYETLYDKENRFSTDIDAGIFIEIGSSFKLLETLSFEFATQAEVIYADYTTRALNFYTINPAASQYLLIEPSFLLGLRWEMRN